MRGGSPDVPDSQECNQHLPQNATSIRYCHLSLQGRRWCAVLWPTSDVCSGGGLSRIHSDRRSAVSVSAGAGCGVAGTF
eukprot:358313-Chlamydomonas_euryale.AAC.1